MGVAIVTPHSGVVRDESALHLLATAHPAPAPPPREIEPLLEVRDATNNARLLVVRRWPTEPRLASLELPGAHVFAWGVETLADVVGPRTIVRWAWAQRDDPEVNQRDGGC